VSALTKLIALSLIGNAPVDTEAMEKLGHGLLVNSHFSPGFSRNKQ